MYMHVMHAFYTQHSLHIYTYKKHRQDDSIGMSTMYTKTYKYLMSVSSFH